MEKDIAVLEQQEFTKLFGTRKKVYGGEVKYDSGDRYPIATGLSRGVAIFKRKGDAVSLFHVLPTSEDLGNNFRTLEASVTGVPILFSEYLDYVTEEADVEDEDNVSDVEDEGEAVIGNNAGGVGVTIESLFHVAIGHNINDAVCDRIIDILRVKCRTFQKLPCICDVTLDTRGCFIYTQLIEAPTIFGMAPK